LNKDLNTVVLPEKNTPLHLKCVTLRSKCSPTHIEQAHIFICSPEEQIITSENNWKF